MTEPPDLEGLREHHAADVETRVFFLRHGYSL
jgi:hypothetical protein